jgi:LysM repeat protein
MKIRVRVAQYPYLSTFFLENSAVTNARFAVIFLPSGVPPSNWPAMTNTDLSSSRKPHEHRRVSLRRPLRCGLTILICSCLFAGAAQCRARSPQDVAEAPRQERARKDAKKAKHVYTDDDMRRAKILTPEDEARVQARRKTPPALDASESEASLDANAEMPQLPLGDIARRYRSAKRAVRTGIPFHLPFDEPVFADPVISVPKVDPPRPNFSPAHPNFVPARPRAVVTPAISVPAPVRRVDPFTRRLVPTAPPSISHAVAAVPQPKAAPAIAPFAPKSDMAKAIAPNAPRPTIASEVAPPSAAAQRDSSLHTITVRPGDSLWKIAQQNLGRGGRWQELLAANPRIVDPARIATGTEIVLPANLNRMTSDRKVNVQQGDTLSKIAQRSYGRGAAWRCVAQANPEIADVNRIYVGQQLLLPFGCDR